MANGRLSADLGVVGGGPSGLVLTIESGRRAIQASILGHVATERLGDPIGGRVRRALGTRAWFGSTS